MYLHIIMPLLSIIFILNWKVLINDKYHETLLGIQVTVRATFTCILRINTRTWDSTAKPVIFPEHG
jgi:hypothetical protein